MEVVVAIALLAIVTVAGMQLMSVTFSPLKNVSQNIFDSIGADISVRGLDYQLGNSEMMRLSAEGAPLFACEGKTMLGPGRPSQTTVLEEVGDAYTFAYARKRTLGVVGPEAGTLMVPDFDSFRPGQILELSTLDALRDAGLFVVQSKDSSAGFLILKDIVPDPPSSIGCSLNKSGRASVLLNPSDPRKVAVDLVSIVRYEVVPRSGAAKERSLVARLWPNGEDLRSTGFSEVISRLGKVTIDEKFEPLRKNAVSTAGAEKGSYRATMTIDFFNIDLARSLAAGNAVRSATMVYEAGYVTGGIEVANQAAIPRPPSVENMYVTCMLTGVPMLNDFVAADGKVVPVYKIEGLYSEAATVNNSFPVFQTQLTSEGDAPRCWTLKEISFGPPGGPRTRPRLNGPGSANVAFELATSTVSPDPVLFDLSSALLMPIVCSVPSAALATSTLQYLDLAAASTIRTVSCSQFDLAGLRKTWVYDGSPSLCTTDGGIFIGRLVNADRPNESGPVLKTATNGCEWAGSPSASCNPAQIFEETPSAKLKTVLLSPDDLTIQNVPGGTKLQCADAD